MTSPGHGPPAPRVGDPDIILDDPRFVITGEHARGGTSVIYRATDTWLGRQVAIKGCGGRDPEAWHRLAHEASILSRLDHPWILPVYHSGTMVSGAPYLATKLVDGETLEQRLKREPATWESLLRHVIDIADAMAYAHGKGVVHRDLKPGNVLIDSQGHTVVIDWGLAREAAGEDLAKTWGSGSPGYRAPEARSGDTADARADIYSVGAILYRMVAGRAAHPEVPVGAELDRDLAAARPELRAIVAKAAAPDPAARYPTAGDLARDLRAAMPRLERGLVPTSRRGKILGALAILCVVGAIAFAAVALLRRDERPRLAGRALQSVPVWTGNFGRALLEIHGDDVRGVYEHDDGVLEGKLHGHVLTIRWCEKPYTRGDDHGTATLDFTAEDAETFAFAGNYTYAASSMKPGPWTLHPATAEAATPELRARLNAWAWRCAD